MLRRSIQSLAACLVLAAGASSALAQVGTAVTYQGQLKNNGTAVNSPSDFRFSLWDAAYVGNQVGATDTKTAVAVSQGLFSTTIDCGVIPYSADAARWLQIEVRNPSITGQWIAMGARQQLMGEPFSFATRGIHVSGETSNIGIGTITPAEKLEVAGNIRVPDVAVIGARQDNGVTGSLTIQAPGTFASDSEGSWGGNLILKAGNCNASCGPVPPVGTSLNNNVQIVAGDNTWDNEGSCGAIYNGNIQFFAGNGQPERMRIVGDTGQVLIGADAVSNSAFLLDVAGDIRCFNLTQTSTRDFKQGIVPVSGALDSIMKLSGVSYTWSAEAPAAVQGKRDIGFIAEEVNQVLPDIVAKDVNGKPVGIDYGKITPVAVEAIKQLKSENDALKARLEKLEAHIAAQSPMPSRAEGAAK